MPVWGFKYSIVHAKGQPTVELMCYTVYCNKIHGLLPYTWYTLVNGVKSRVV